MALLLLTFVAPAQASVPAAGASDPAVDQYVESVPTAGGDPEPKTKSRSGGEPPAGAQGEIEPGGDADVEALEAVEESPELGAPAVERGKKRRDTSDSAEPASEHRPSTVDAVSSAAVSGDGNPGGWILGAVALLTAALGAAAFARARRSKPR